MVFKFVKTNLGYLYFLMCLVSQCRHLWWESQSQMVKPNLVRQDVLLWLVTILPLWSTALFQSLLFQFDGQYFPKCGSRTLEHLWAHASHQCDLGSRCWSHMWVELLLVCSLALRGFSPCTSGVSIINDISDRWSKIFKWCDNQL